MTKKHSNHEKTLLTISEISKELDLPSHVLRFWEKQFIQIKPTRHNDRRYYNVENIETIKRIKDLLYNQGFTIEGAKKELGRSKNNNSTPPKALCDYKAELLDIRESLKNISRKLDKYSNI